MYEAFLEASTKAKFATVFFLLGKMMFIGTAASMMISDTAAFISLSLYVFFIFGSIVLCILDGTGKKKTYAELEKKINELKLKLSNETPH